MLVLAWPFYFTRRETGKGTTLCMQFHCTQERRTAEPTPLHRSAPPNAPRSTSSATQRGKHETIHLTARLLMDPSDANGRDQGSPNAAPVIACSRPRATRDQDHAAPQRRTNNRCSIHCYFSLPYQNGTDNSETICRGAILKRQSVTPTNPGR